MKILTLRYAAGLSMYSGFLESGGHYYHYHVSPRGSQLARFPCRVSTVAELFEKTGPIPDRNAILSKPVDLQELDYALLAAVADSMVL